MQKKNVCNICYKNFTRKWNLDRHLYDVHEVQNDLRRVRIKQGIDVPNNLSNMVEPERKILNRDNTMSQSPQYNQSYYNNNNNLPNNSPYYYYGYDNNTSSSYPYSNIDSRYKEEEKKRLSIDDKIKIQKILKNLENYLEKFYTRAFIFQIILWLRHQCFTQKSDEPLKKFLVQKNIGFLWQY